MRRKNENGFIHIIVYLLIFVIFAFTVYTCLDILDLIEVPEKYSVSKWLSENSKKIENTEDVGRVVENVYQNVRVEIENKFQETESNVISPTVGNYISQ